MAEITKTILIQETLDKIWKVVADFGGAGTWNQEMSNVLLTSDIKNGVGTKRTADHGGMGPTFTLEQEIVELEENQRLTYTSKILKGDVPLTDVRTIFGIEPAGEDTRVTLTFTFNVKEGASEADVHDALTKSMTDTLAALKHYVETGQRLV